MTIVPLTTEQARDMADALVALQSHLRGPRGLQLKARNPWRSHSKKRKGKRR
jgi:hypothetical protein